MKCAVWALVENPKSTFKPIVAMTDYPPSWYRHKEMGGMGETDSGTIFVDGGAREILREIRLALFKLTPLIAGLS